MKMRAPTKEEAKALGQAFARARQTLAQTRNARRAPRCEHVQPNGERCGSPALRAHTLCWQHREQLVNPPRRPRPPIQNGTQAALDYVVSELWAGRMDTNVGGALLHGLQCAMGRTKLLRATAALTPHPDAKASIDAGVPNAPVVREVGPREP